MVGESCFMCESVVLRVQYGDSHGRSGGRGDFSVGCASAHEKSSMACVRGSPTRYVKHRARGDLSDVVGELPDLLITILGASNTRRR